MTNEELKALLDELLKQGKELEWLEFKLGDATDNQRLGKYISGLANAANFNNVTFAYLVCPIPFILIGVSSNNKIGFKRVGVEKNTAESAPTK